MKHLLSMLALICVTLTAITFSITACSDEAPDLGRSTKIDLSSEVSIEMIKVEAGTFKMSKDDGKAQSNEVPHKATLTKDFYLGQTEVTQAQWRAVMGTNPSHFKGDDLPVEYVSWYDAMEFCEKLNEMGNVPKGWGITLPTETQWEYAARGGKKSKGYKYSGSNSIDEVAWYEDNSSETHPVGQKKGNELGLHDMSGNVIEWCLDDWTDDSSKLAAEFERENDRSGSPKAMRGGGGKGYSAAGCRSASRDNDSPERRYKNVGFRLALVQVSSDKTDAEVQYKLGLSYREKLNYYESAKWFLKAAEQGHAEAQRELGDYFLRVGHIIEADCIAADKLKPLVSRVLLEKGKNVNFYVDKMTDEIAMTVTRIMTEYIPSKMSQEDFMIELFESITNKSTSPFSNTANLAASVWMHNQRESGKKVHASDFVDEFKKWRISSYNQLSVLDKIVGDGPAEKGYRYSSYTDAQQYNIGGKLSEYVDMSNRFSVAIAAAATREKQDAWRYLFNVYLGRELSDLSGEELDKALLKHKDKTIREVYSEMQASYTVLNIGFHQYIGEKKADKTRKIPKQIKDIILDQQDIGISKENPYKRMYKRMYEEATVWYRKAANQGNKAAKETLKQLGY